MTLANKITMLRIFLVPVFLALEMIPFSCHLLWAAVVFFIASMSDILDGWVARRSNHVSDFGKVFDPIADKLMVLAALIPLTAAGRVPQLAAVVILGRELLVSGLRIVAVSGGGGVIAASWLGKAKTISQDVAVILILARDDVLDRFLAFPIESAALWVALIFTVWSTVDYFIKNKSALKRGDI